MAVMAVQPQAEDPLVGYVIEALRGGEMTPPALIEKLTQERRVSDAAIRVVIWYLISQHQLELSPEQRLRLAPAGA